MTIDKINDSLYVFRHPDEVDNELYRLFDQWNDTEFLLEFFTTHLNDLRYYNIDNPSDAVFDTIEDADELEHVFMSEQLPLNFNDYIKPLDNTETHELNLSKKKARIYKRDNNSSIKHDCWLRIYAIKLGDNCYVVTGGAIKLTGKMGERQHTQYELTKIERCCTFLKEKGLYEAAGLNDYIKNEQ